MNNYDYDNQNKHFDHMEVLRSDKPRPLSVHLGVLAGIFAGLFVYLYVEPYQDQAILVGAVVALIVATLLRFIGKYFFTLCIIAYVVYCIVG
ncbi:MAG: hypothetical protein AB8G86_01830 [Saprospiraceae bacterium]